MKVIYPKMLAFEQMFEQLQVITSQKYFDQVVGEVNVLMSRLAQLEEDAVE